MDIKTILINLCSVNTYQQDCQLRKGCTCDKCINIIRAEMEIRKIIEYESNSDGKQQSKLLKLWEEFGNIPITEDDKLDAPFHVWPKGADRFEIWHWFDELLENGLGKDILDRK